MLPWFTKYPNQNDEILNLDWVITQVENLKAAYEAFLAANSLTFADPITWDITKQYSKNTIVLSPEGDAFLSKKAVGKGIQLNNTDYWLEIFNFAEYVRTANSNLTMHIEQNTERATAAYAVDDWLLWDDVLYKVTAAIDVDDLLTIGTNIVHFTVEDFCRAWVTYSNNLIIQYKNDIDASELAYRNQLAQDIATTTESLQAQLDAAIAGATVDSEVINARVGQNGYTYSTLGDAIRDQLSEAFNNLTRKDNALSLFDGNTFRYNNYVPTRSNRQIATSNNRAEVLIYPEGRPYNISIAAGYQFALYIYDDDDQEIKTVAFSANDYYVREENAAKIEIVIKHDDDSDITDYGAIYDALNITLSITSLERYIGGGTEQFNIVPLLVSQGTRIYLNVFTKYSDVTISLNNPAYYYFVWVYDEEGNEIANSVSWKTNTSISFKAAYKIRIGIKIGSAGTTNFSASDITALSTDLTVTGLFKSLVSGYSNQPVYVDTAGNDLTGDGSASSPFATVSRALEVSNHIIIEAGTYTDNISISDRDNVVIMSDPIKANNDDTVTISSNTFHVLMAHNCNNLVIDGIIFDGATNDVVTIYQCNNVKIQNCEFNNSSTLNGLNLAQSDAVVYSSKANGNHNDGFNMHYYGNTVFIDCSADSNGADGISHHEECTGAVIGGYWTNNGKAGISTPTYGATVNISDAICAANVYGMQCFGGDDMVENSKEIKVSNVLFLNNSSYGIQIDKYIVDLVNCIFSGNTHKDDVQSGTLNEY